MPVERSQVISILKTLFPFSKLNDSQLGLVAEKFQPVNFKAGDIIFNQGRQAEMGCLYIVLDGKVKLSVRQRTHTEELVFLGEGEMFGHEALGHHALYLTTAAAVSGVTLLRLDQGQVRILMEKIPEICVPLKMELDSYTLRVKTPLSWCGKDEVVYFMARRHPFSMYYRMIPVIVFSVVTIAILAYFIFNNPQNSNLPYTFSVIDFFVILLWGGWNYLDWTNDYSIITNQRILFQEYIILLYESRREAPLNAILSASTETTQMGRIFSFGDVIVRTYAGSITLSMVKNPLQVKLLVELLWSLSKKRQMLTDREAFENIIRVKIGLANTPPPTAKKTSPPLIESVRPSALANLLNWLSEALELRIEKGGIVTYRTHWFILLERIFLPTLSLIGLGFGVVELFIGKIPYFAFSTGLMIAVGLFVVLGAWWVYQYVDWHNDYYVINMDQVLDVYKKPLGNEKIQAAPLKNINSVDFERIGFIGLLLNYGTVTIRVGEDKLTFNNVFNPAEIQRDLFKRLAERDFNEKQTAQEAERQRVAEWLSAYHRVVEGDRRSKRTGA